MSNASCADILILFSTAPDSVLGIYRMGVFYNKSIDQIAMTCVICDKIRKQPDDDFGANDEWYGEHMRVQHGMVT